MAQEETGKKKPLSLSWKIPISCGGIQEHRTRREGETKRTKSTTKQDFSEEVLWKQNIKAWLASRSCYSSPVPIEWFAIFSFGANNSLMLSRRQDAWRQSYPVVLILTLRVIVVMVSTFLKLNDGFIIGKPNTFDPRKKIEYVSHCWPRQNDWT